MQNAPFQHFVKATKLNLPRGKTSEISQAWSHVLLNLRHKSFQTKGRLVRMVDQIGGKFERF